MKKNLIIGISIITLAVFGATTAANAEGKSKGKKAEQRNEQTRTADNGSERSRETNTRNRERKEIQDSYKEARRAGEGEKVKGKKPWWKFWGSEEAE